MFRWDRTATACAVVKDALSYRASFFCSFPLQNSTLQSASKAAPAGASRNFALCGERPKGFQPSGHLTSAAALDQLMSLR
ncbi:MAG: hypothetical protein J6C96_09960 [Oscillospiraceae bacterium]|nr:hypothetical protein [Oscillospiraceae bacterium]